MSTSGYQPPQRLGKDRRIEVVWRTPLSLNYTLMKDTIFRHLYRLFVCIDANFRMKRKAVSSDIADPGLNTGIAYFVGEVGYKAFLAQHDPKAHQDVSGQHEIRPTLRLAIDSLCLILHRPVHVRTTVPSTMIVVHGG